MSRGYLALLILVAAVAGGGGYLLSHPMIPDIDGIACQPMEAHGFHIHAHLELWHEGKPVKIPAGIGFSTGCFYWLHTHTPDGIIHVEAPSDRHYTLGQFFQVWGETAPELGPGVTVLVNRGQGFEPYQGDWKALVLVDRMQIALGSGEFTPQAFEFPADL